MFLAARHKLWTLPQLQAKGGLQLLLSALGRSLLSLSLCRLFGLTFGGLFLSRLLLGGLLLFLSGLFLCGPLGLLLSRLLGLTLGSLTFGRLLGGLLTSGLFLSCHLGWLLP